MNIQNTAIIGAWIIESEAFRDDRGMFSRHFCARELQELFGARTIVQINHSTTRKVGAVRGLHYQNAPHAEMKLVRCLKGRVFDVAVDLRQDSPTFRKWNAVELTPESNLAYLIPEGCAHGFQVLEENSQLLYMHTEFYTPQSEVAVRFDDPCIGVNWPLEPTDVSARDKSHPLLNEIFEGVSI
jgi:dTDP-4-dehydrorhamnose 3,5-epimerase